MIVLALSFAFFLVLAILFTNPASISTQSLRVIFTGYAATFAAQFYVYYRLPWVKLGRLALQTSSSKNTASDRDQTHPGATAKGTETQFQQQQDPLRKVEQ